MVKAFVLKACLTQLIFPSRAMQLNTVSLLAVRLAVHLFS